MLCAKYNYKADIAIKKKEAFEDGMEAGLNKKADETARNFLKMNIGTYEQIAQGTGLSVEKIMELANEIHKD